MYYVLAVPYPTIGVLPAMLKLAEDTTRGNWQHYQLTNKGRKPPYVSIFKFEYSIDLRLFRVLIQLGDIEPQILSQASSQTVKQLLKNPDKFKR